jgi:serine/threonine protein kinase
MFFQILSGRPYGREVDWWSFGVVMYDMMCGLSQRPIEFEIVEQLGLRFVTREAASIINGVSCLSALPVSVTGNLFTILQQSWWEQIMWLDYKLTVFCYFQLLTRNPKNRLGARGDTCAIQSHAFFRTLDWEKMQQKPVTSNTPVTINVSTTGFVFNFCHKGLSLKLNVKGDITVL